MFQTFHSDAMWLAWSGSQVQNVVSTEDWKGCNVDKIRIDGFPKCTLGKARIENSEKVWMVNWSYMHQHSRKNDNIPPHSDPIWHWTHLVAPVHCRRDNSRMLPWVSADCQRWTSQQAGQSVSLDWTFQMKFQWVHWISLDVDEHTLTEAMRYPSITSWYTALI